MCLGDRARTRISNIYFAAESRDAPSRRDSERFIVIDDQDGGLSHMPKDKEIDMTWQSVFRNVSRDNPIANWQSWCATF
jgi:hypothetical protein